MRVRIKKRKFIIVLLVVSFWVTCIPFVTLEKTEAGINKPSLVVYKKLGHVKAEWGIEMEESDILYKTGVEAGDEIPNFVYWYSPGNKGGQSITTEDKYNGARCVKIVNTLINGNWFKFPDTSSTISIMQFNRIYVPNDTNLAFNFKAKSTGEGTLWLFVDGGHGESLITLPNIVTAAAPVGSTIIHVNTTEGLQLGRVITPEKVGNENVDNMYVIMEINTSNNTIKLNRPLTKAFNKGDNLKTRPWRNWEKSRCIDKNTWQNFNVNIEAKDFEDYSISERGAAVYIRSQTGNIIYLDDVSYGYATEAELYRNGQLVYKGYLADYEDKEATDKTAPAKISAVDVSFSNNKAIISFAVPKDSGTTYNYQIKAIKRNGAVIPSDIKPVTTIASGIKGYSYIINQDLNDNNVGSQVNLMTNQIEATLEPGMNYLHIRTIDNAGNVSQVATFPIENKTESIIIYPKGLCIRKGNIKQLTVTAQFSSGYPKDVTNEAIYKSNNINVATVNSAGKITGKAVGQTTVTVTYGGISAQVAVEVRPRLYIYIRTLL